MTECIVVRNARYYPASAVFGPDIDISIVSDIQTRRSFLSASEVVLDRTIGLYADVEEGRILFVIDLATIGMGSDEWGQIGKIIEKLVVCAPGLNEQAKRALGVLHAVVFTSSPARAYADVKPRCFVYDVDEFRRSDHSLITPAYAVSNIVHDSNHIWMFENQIEYTGVPAEITCWDLQLANADAIGLDQTERDFITSLIADPEQVIARINEDPIQRVCCKELGKSELRA